MCDCSIVDDPNGDEDHSVALVATKPIGPKEALHISRLQLIHWATYFADREQALEAEQKEREEKRASRRGKRARPVQLRDDKDMQEAADGDDSDFELVEEKDDDEEEKKRKPSKKKAKTHDPVQPSFPAPSFSF